MVVLLTGLVPALWQSGCGAPPTWPISATPTTDCPRIAVVWWSKLLPVRLSTTLRTLRCVMWTLFLVSGVGFQLSHCFTTSVPMSTTASEIYTCTWATKEGKGIKPYHQLHVFKLINQMLYEYTKLLITHCLTLKYKWTVFKQCLIGCSLWINCLHCCWA